MNIKNKILIFFLIITSFLTGRYVRFKMFEKLERKILITDLEKEKNEFTIEKFADELNRLNVKFPEIVLAQAIVETGDFNSKLFKENNNLFGMKEASVRINTAKGTQNNYAFYDNWYESVYDYAFYQCRYLSNIKTEKDYYNYLSKRYAESGKYYITQIKSTIKTKNLKKYFY